MLIIIDALIEGEWENFLEWAFGIKPKEWKDKVKEDEKI